MAKKVILVGSMKGGVGKTTLATGLVDVARGAEVFAQAVEEVRARSKFPTLMADFRKVADAVLAIDVDVEPGKETSHSALSRRFPDVVPFAIAPTVEALVADPNRAYGHFDQLHETILRAAETVVVDFGANVLNRWLEWLTVSEGVTDWIDAGAEVHFVTVTTADASAFRAATEAIEAMAGLCAQHGWPVRLHLALNARDGGFSAYEDSPEWQRIVALGDVSSTFHIERSWFDVWKALDSTGRAPSVVLNMPMAELAAAFPGLSRAQLRREWNFLADWVHKFTQETLAVGLLGKAAEAERPEVAAQAVG